MKIRKEENEWTKESRQEIKTVKPRIINAGATRAGEEKQIILK